MQRNSCKVLYDGSCPLCDAEIGHYRRKDVDRALELIDISQSAALPDGLTREHAMKRFHVISPDGKLLSGAAAFVELWRHVPGWKGVARVAALPGVTQGLELVYRGFLRLRPVMVYVFRLVTRRQISG